MITKRLPLISMIAVLIFTLGTAPLFAHPTVSSEALTGRLHGVQYPHAVTLKLSEPSRNEEGHGAVSFSPMVVIGIAGVVGGLGFFLLDPARQRHQVGLIAAAGSYGFLAIVHKLN